MNQLFGLKLDTEVFLAVLLPLVTWLFGEAATGTDKGTNAVVAILEMVAVLLRRFAKSVSGAERPSPKPRIRPQDVIVNRVARSVIVLNVSPEISVTPIADTNSMDPAIDQGHLVLLEPVTDHSDLIAGDIIVFHWPGLAYSIIHRIIDIKHDEQGRRHYKCKGDNNAFADPYDIMDEHVVSVYRGELV